MSKYILDSMFDIKLPLRAGVKVRVQHGKWKYKLLDDVTIRVRMLDFPKITRRLYELTIQDSHKIEHPYFTIRLGFLGYIEIEAKKGYAFDGVTAASFLEDPETLYRALWHDILMQAIYDCFLLPRNCIDESHEVFIAWNPSTKSKFIYYSLMLLHKPWNRITSL